MKIQQILYLIPFLILSCVPQQESEKNNDIAEQEYNKPKNKVILAITGYGSDLENITLDSLKSLYQNQKIYVLNNIKKEADSLLKGKNTQTLNSLKEFRKIAKNNILITDLNNLSNQFKVLAIDSIVFFQEPRKYSLYTQSEDFEFKKNVTKFILTGVTAITRMTGRTAHQHGSDFLVEKVEEYFQDADFVHISNEVSFYPNCDYYHYIPDVYKFCSREEDFNAFKKLNTNIVELTGNHNLDFGSAGYKETFEWYQKNNMKTFGGGLSPEQANTPLIIKLKDGKTMAFIGFNEACPVGECADFRQDKQGANHYNKEKAQKIIKHLKKVEKVDIVFASVQFAEIDSYIPTQSQFDITKDLVDFGADFVYGSQAHQVQKVEFYKGKAIFHGLGNFLFDQTHRLGVRQAFFLENYIYNGKVIQSIPIYTLISQYRRPEIATKDEEKAIRTAIFQDDLLYK